MSRNLYIATMEANSGKSLVVLGIMELLSHRVDRLGFFRPVVRTVGQRDNDTELIRVRYGLQAPYESLYAATHEEARDMVAAGRDEELLKRIFAKYKRLERQCDFVVCEGTDFAGVASAFEFDFNAQVANHIGCPLLIVAGGQGKTPDETVDVVRASRESYGDEGCTILATVANRVEAARVQEVSQRLHDAWPYPDPVHVIPEQEFLGKPTVGEVAEALGARCVHSDEKALDREVNNYKVAAMHLANFLDHVETGSLIITPGDRSDVILGSLATTYSEAYPPIVGIVLTGGLQPAPQVQRLIDGFRRPFVPILSVETDTYQTAMKVNSVRAAITPGNERKIAAALGAFESAVDLADLDKRIAATRSTRVTPIMFEYELIEQAKADRQHIVLPEGTDERILRAAEILLRREVVEITLLGDEQEIHERIDALVLHLESVKIVDPARSSWQADFARTYFELRKHKGITEDFARDEMLDVSYFGTMMVYKDMVDGMVSGAAHTTAHTIRPAFEFIRTRPGCTIVSSVFLMCLADRVLVYGDCAVNPDPTPRQLADIAVSSAETARMFGIEPRIAMLSYSTGESGRGEEVEKVREATRIARQLRPDLGIEGPIQYDAAVDAGVARKKMPKSDVAGRATVFIFPDLNTGNNTYKAVQRSAGAVAIGPVLQGLKKPVNDLSRGCTVPDVVNTVAITAIQAQKVDSAS